MSATTKIRINELARELEVKAREILRILPDMGIEGKRTHSSSLEESQAEQVRDFFRKKKKAAVAKTEPAEEPRAEEGKGVTAKVKPPRTHAPAPAAAAPSIPAVGGGTPLRPPVQALRPPLRKPVSAPAAPATPTPEVAAKRAAKPPAAAKPSVPGKPETAAPPERPKRPAATVPGEPAREAPAARTAPVKPIPTQPVAGRQPVGPRAPLSPQARDAGQPGAPAAPPVPGTPIRPPVSRQTPGKAAPRIPRPSRPVSPPRQAGGEPGQVTQPAKKPVLVPGQPIYQRPRRPTTIPGMPVGGRPRVGHPTGGAAPIPGTPAHRPHDGRRVPRPSQPRLVRDREAEREQKFLRRQEVARAPAAPPRAVNTEITVSPGTTVKELAEKLGIKANLVIKALVDRGVFATINQTLDVEMLQDLCKYFGATTTEVSFEEEAMQDLALTEAAADREKRAPVVTVMGHVDHGKTSLLDAIRQSNVAEREAGGITQAIGAYHVEHQGRKIVFIDTPGHEAFTRMRARGAKVTDVVILVVAADDGVMPQTIEAIDHAKAAGVPIVVAINKIDLPNAEPERVKQQLADRGLLPEDWGGDTVMVPVSAKANQNLDLLLEMVLLVTDMGELTSNPSRPAVGTVLESKLDRGQGPVATVLVQNGTLRVGDYFLVGAVFGKVRAMIDDHGNKVQEAPPSTAVVVLGLEGLPAPGDLFQVVTDTEKAKQIGEYREDKAREQTLAKSSRLSLEQFQEQLRSGEIKELPLVLKCDVQGSMEVLVDTLEKLSTDKVKVRLIHAGVGAISESDVLLATAANAIIIGFGVRPERSAAVLAEREKVDIRLHTVIYEVVDELKRAMTGLLEPIIKETFQGRADVLDTFRVSKVGTVAGCVVQEGRITRNSQIRLLRDNVVVYTGKVASLRRFKDEASEVRAGQECGIGLENFNDVKKDDVLEAFVTEKVAQEVFA